MCHGGGLPAGEHEAVEAGLVDDGGLLRPTKGVGNNDPLFVIIQPGGSIAGIRDLQHPAHIGKHEQP